MGILCEIRKLEKLLLEKQLKFNYRVKFYYLIFLVKCLTIRFQIFITVIKTSKAESKQDQNNDNPLPLHLSFVFTTMFIHKVFRTLLYTYKYNKNQALIFQQYKAI